MRFLKNWHRLNAPVYSDCFLKCRELKYRNDINTPYITKYSTAEKYSVIQNIPRYITKP